MKNLSINIIFVLWLSVVVVAKEVALNDPAIKVTGAKYTHVTPEKMEYLSFPPEVLSMGNRQLQLDYNQKGK